MIDGISIREAASELGVSVQTVHNRIKSGALDGEKTNTGWRGSARWRLPKRRRQEKVVLGTGRRIS